MKSPSIPRIEGLTIKNYRVIRDLELKDIKPYTVFLGPNGSGKSTIFDVFAFLSECFQSGLKTAWAKRGKFKELRTRGTDPKEPIVIELKYREKEKTPLITYHISINEGEKGNPVISEEWLQWRRAERGKPFRFLDFKNGKGTVVSGDNPDESDERIQESLASPDMLAVNTLGQFEKHPRVSALRRFITGWSMSYISVNELRMIHDAGPQEDLSPSGDNLVNVIQYLSENEPEKLEKIIRRLSNWIPRLDSVNHEYMSDGTMCLKFKDLPFDEPVIAKYVSDGTLRLLAYLVLLYSSSSAQLIGIEEPENQLHPRLLEILAEEFRHAATETQLFVTTHSPFFVNALQPEEVRVLYRDEQGFTHAVSVSDMPEAMAFIEAGAQIGSLWMEGVFTAGDPLENSGMPKRTFQKKLIP